MKYTPEQVDLQRADQLFQDAVPDSVCRSHPQLGNPLSEIELRRRMAKRAAENEAARFLCFAGGGAYDHYIPSVVDALAGRAEFTTSYTQYQPELSQGMLQALFEFQTMMSELLGMEVVNTSMYDGASSMAEAALMAVRIKGERKRKILVASLVNPLYKKVLQTYLVRGAGLEIAEIPEGEHGRTDLAYVASLPEDNDVACVILQSPNFFGVIENLHGMADVIHAKDALFVLSSHPLSHGMFKTPGEFGADIATGEMQPLGIPLAFGGPYAGFFATKKEYLRQMPGRLVGETVDTEGARAYTLTLSTREQHIRRFKATSNICTNQALMTLRAGIYLATMGSEGIRETAAHAHAKARYLVQEIRALRRFRVPHDSFFNEFLVESDLSLKVVQRHLERRGILALFPKKGAYTFPRNSFLVAVTEKHSREDLDLFVRALKEVEDANATVR